nr:ABC transporter ATP-binding protein [Enterococcus cecorum]
MFELKNISKVYSNNLHVLDELSLNVKSGEFVSIMGTSGTGKSTLVNILGLLDEEYTGSYIFQDTEIHSLNDNQKSEYRNQNIGFIFQNFHLIKEYTVMENICLPYLYTKDQIDKAHIEKLLIKMHLIDKKDEICRNLSGGQKQRVALIRALVRKPQLLIADEPTGALDEKNSQALVDLLLKLNQQEKLTILMVTHDKKVAKQADKIYQLEQGKLVEKIYDEVK